MRMLLQCVTLISTTLIGIISVAWVHVVLVWCSRVSMTCMLVKFEGQYDLQLDQRV